MKQLAVDYGVCVRPVTLRQTNLATGVTELIDMPCGATREDKCPSCAERAKRLRQRQIREGWHRTDEPNPGPDPATPEQKALIALRAHLEFERADADRTAQWHQVADLDAAIDEVEQAIAAEGLRGRIAPPHDDPDDQGDTAPKQPKKKRSTKRRQDVPDLPRQKVEARTVGRTYTAPGGTVHQPPQWLTLTLDSYGPVHGQRKTSNGKPLDCRCGRFHTDDDPLIGVPVDPATYDYRRAAWDAVHFPRLLDRYWQNLRRCVGRNVQYAGCVEPQKAPRPAWALRHPGGSGAPLTRGTFRSRIWKPALLRSGLPVALRFHDLRHSYATWLVSDGVPVNDVQRVMGHEQASTTLNRYTHGSDDRDTRVLGAFADDLLTFGVPDEAGNEEGPSVEGP